MCMQENVKSASLNLRISIKHRVSEGRRRAGSVATTRPRTKMDSSFLLQKKSFALGKGICTHFSLLFFVNKKKQEAKVKRKKMECGEI